MVQLTSHALGYLPSLVEVLLQLQEQAKIQFRAELVSCLPAQFLRSHHPSRTELLSRATCATEPKDDEGAVEVVDTEGRHAATNPGRPPEVAEVERPETLVILNFHDQIPVVQFRMLPSPFRSPQLSYALLWLYSIYSAKPLASSRNPVALIPLEEVTRLLRRGRVSRLN